MKDKSLQWYRGKKKLLHVLWLVYGLWCVFVCLKVYERERENDVDNGGMWWFWNRSSFIVNTEYVIIIDTRLLIQWKLGRRPSTASPLHKIKGRRKKVLPSIHIIINIIFCHVRRSWLNSKHYTTAQTYIYIYIPRDVVVAHKQWVT